MPASVVVNVCCWPGKCRLEKRVRGREQSGGGWSG